MRARRRLAVFFLALAALSAAAFAAPPRLKEHEVDVKVVGEGFASADDPRMDLFIVFGPLFRAGARLYSEPSHTLLFLGLSPATAESPEAEELKEEARKARAVVRVGNFYGAERVTVRNPAGDNRLAVWAMTGDGDFLVAHGKVTLGRFHFTTSWGEWLANPTHCCYCNGASCVESRAPEFTCCWCPTSSAAVGWVECPDDRPTSGGRNQ